MQMQNKKGQQYNKTTVKSLIKEDLSIYNCLNTPSGTKLLEHLKKKFHFYKTTGGDQLKEGERTAILYLIDGLNKLQSKGQK